MEQLTIIDSKSIKTFKTIQSEVESINKVALSVDCVIFGFDENKLKVLLIRSDLEKFEANCFVHSEGGKYGNDSCLASKDARQ